MKLLDKLKTAKKNKIKKEPENRSFLTKNFAIYIGLLVFGILFTQALRSVISAIVFVFILVLPIISLVYALIGRAKIFTRVEASCGETYKFEPVTFDVTIDNGAIFPYPFVEADFVIPDENAVRCSKKRVQFALLPNSFCKVTEEVRFPYRGNYEIGVSDVYIYDLFKMFRFTVHEDLFWDIFVMPRRLTLSDKNEHAASDVNTESSKNIRGVDRSDVNEVKPYQFGDQQKNIHWKLSSKTEELMVKHYAMNSGKTVYIFVDLARHFKNIYEGTPYYDDDINEYCADGVIEIALALASRELRAGNNCNMIWYDHRNPSGNQICALQAPEDLDYIFKAFATAPLCAKDDDVVNLTALIGETQGITTMFVTGCVDTDLVRSMNAMTKLFGGLSAQETIDVYYFNPEAKIIDEKERAKYTNTVKYCTQQLRGHSIVINETKL